MVFCCFVFKLVHCRTAVVYYYYCNTAIQFGVLNLLDELLYIDVSKWSLS